jgi:hypothetical protein
MEEKMEWLSGFFVNEIFYGHSGKIEKMEQFNYLGAFTLILYTFKTYWAFNRLIFYVRGK